MFWQIFTTLIEKGTQLLNFKFAMDTGYKRLCVHIFSKHTHSCLLLQTKEQRTSQSFMAMYLSLDLEEVYS